MRIIHTSDWHLGKSLSGNSRLPEQAQFLKYFIDKCNELKPDLILIAGDIYDNSNPSAQAEELFYETLKSLSRGGECISFIIAGNHDNPERLTAASPLAKEHGIVMLGTLKTVIEKGKYGKCEVVNAKEGFVELKIGDENVAIAALPYPSEKRISEAFYEHTQTMEEKRKTYAEKIGEIFSELQKNYRKDCVNLAVAHIFAMKGYEGSSERTGSLGDSFLVDREYLPKNADYIALGHIHKPLSLDKEGKIRYSGSPIHYNIDETSYDKKFFVIDVKAGEAVNVTEELIPIFKPMERWNCGSIDEAIEMCRKHGGEDSFVYITVETDVYITDAQIKEMKSFKDGIIDIIPNIKNQDDEQHTVKIGELSFSEQFAEFYKFRKRGAKPSEELMKLFDEIVSDAQDLEEENPDEAN